MFQLATLLSNIGFVASRVGNKQGKRRGRKDD